MSDWTTIHALREQVQRRWDKGELLAELVAPGELFPLRLALRAPSSRDLSDRFDEVRAWAADLQHGVRTGYRIVMRDVRHRVIGRNSLPEEVWVDTLDDAIRLIGRTGDARTFRLLLTATMQQQPECLPWLQRQPLRSLALAEQWPRLLALSAWMRAHPRPGIYLRQVDLPGIDTKFVEAQRGVLSELFDLMLPAPAIDREAGGVAQFARRYGFRDKPLRIRFRWLDPEAPDWVEGGDGDYAVSQVTFARIEPDVERVFITENEINFLAFPPAPRSLVIFGAGYGFDAFAAADWLDTCDLYYWGDIDTHGFAILDQLRSKRPQAKSFLMDRHTLLAHRTHWTIEPQQTLRDLPRLNADERALYDDLRYLRLGDQPVRLEQERIGFEQVTQATLRSATSSP